MKMQKAISMENVPWSELGKQNVKAEKVYNSNALRMEVNRKLTNTDKINQFILQIDALPTRPAGATCCYYLYYIYLFLDWRSFFQ